MKNYTQEELKKMYYMRAPEYVKFESPAGDGGTGASNHVCYCPYPGLYVIWHVDPDDDYHDIDEYNFMKAYDEIKYQWLKPDAVFPEDNKVKSEEELISYLNSIGWHGKVICETYPECIPALDLYEEERVVKTINV